MRTSKRLSTICLHAFLVLAALGACSDRAFAGVDLNRDIFSKGNMKDLCVTSGDRKVVSRKVLATRLMNLVPAFDSLDQKIRLLRQVSAEVQPADDDSWSENVIYFVSNSRPFGVNHEYTDEENEIVLKQLPVFAALTQWLAGRRPNENYKVIGGSTPPDPERYFQKESPYEIVCKGKKPGGGAGGAGGKKGGAASGNWTKNVVVRKKVSDIAVPSTKLKKANGAQFSYKDDGIKGKQTISVEGLVGFVITGTGADPAHELSTRSTIAEPSDLYWFKVVPYVYYKNVTQNPRAKSDIDYFSPGVTGNLEFINRSNTFSFKSQFEGSATLDQEHDSNVYNVGVRFSPSFYDGHTVWFGAPLNMYPFLVRPDLTLVAREYVIGSRGTNPALVGLNSFTGLGYDAELHAYLKDTIPVLSSFVAKAAYIYRYNSNGVVDVNRFTAGLSYVLNKNFTFDLDYTRGRDVNTLQDEDLWTAGLSFRN